MLLRLSAGVEGTSVNYMNKCEWTEYNIEESEKYLEKLNQCQQIISFEEGSNLYDIGIRALILSLPGIALQGINVYVQSLFTAFSDALVSGILSALNTFVFMVAA